MNRRELAKAVAVQADVPLKTVIQVIEGFTDVVTGVVAKGETIAIPGFVRFVKVDRPARMGRNPATGEQMMFKASKKVRVSAAKAFRDSVMNPSRATRALKRGAYPIIEDYVKKAGAAPVPAKAAAKAPAKKAPAKRTTAKKVAKRAPAKKAPAKRTTAKKVAKRAPAKRTTAKRAPARKAPAKRTTAKRAPATRTAAKKTTKRAPARRR